MQAQLNAVSNGPAG